MTRKVLIYLSDLTHTGRQIATESFPLNIGLVASYALQRLAGRVEIRLFKYPERLIAALKSESPDILGCSNYVWNSNLAEWILGFAKRLNPHVVTVIGGTNYPYDAEGQLEFLRSRPNTDFGVFYEGEQAFLNLVERYREEPSVHGMKQRPIDGCQFISPTTGALMSGSALRRSEALDSIASPYTTGLMDEFFDGQLTPMIETTRGCPFACNFCNAGDRYFNKVNMFSLDYIRDELSYIAPRISAVGVSHLTIADNNFGMYPRDADICEVLRDTQIKYGWPRGIICWTGKNKQARIIRATEILGLSLSVSMSVQSMDRQVLQNIKRDNIKFDDYKAINSVLTDQGRSGIAEIIWALPGESYESFMSGIRALIDAGATKITSYTLQLLYGTDYKRPDYRQEHEYQGKFRLIPLDYGEYEEERILEIEEVAVTSKYASFNDYLLVRGFALITEAMYNNKIFQEVVKYLAEHGVSPYDWMRQVWDRRDIFPAEIAEIFRSFRNETENELFDSEDELRAFYGETAKYKKLLDGEIGGNVVFKHKVRLLGQLDKWLTCIILAAKTLILQRADSQSDMHRVNDEIAAIRTYLSLKLGGVLDPQSGFEPIVGTFQYNIPLWLESSCGARLADFREANLRLEFFYQPDQTAELQDSYRRYGTDMHGLAKILARIPSNERLFRKVAPAATVLVEEKA